MQHTRDSDDDEADDKKRRSYQRVLARSILIYLLVLLGVALFMVGSFHLIVFSAGVAHEYSHISPADPAKNNPYEQFVQQLVTKPEESASTSSSSSSSSSSFSFFRKQPKKEPTFVGRVFPLRVKDEHQQYIQSRINQRNEYLTKTRPPLPASAPKNEKELKYEKLYTIVKKWNPDHPDVPPDFRETLPHFNWGNPKERKLAEDFRNAELPFKVYNISEFTEVSLKWDDFYLESNLGKMKSSVHVEKSKDNHFMFWSVRGGRIPAGTGYKPPTEVVSDLSFRDYLNIVKQADEEKWNSSTVHYYYTLGVPPHDHRYFVGKDLPSFSDYHNNFFVSNVNANKGIQCRIGMRGVIAETHYDSGRNMVAMLLGAKRYILSPPRACSYLGIISDRKHPSYRHSIIDWSDLQQAKANKFDVVDSIDTILHMGEVLYIPSFWFHYIVSLEYSMQCNSRSGYPATGVGRKEIKDCLHHDV
jgi:hypothetical protein